MLLICLVLPFLGSYTWYHFQRKMVRKEIKWRLIKGMERKDLIQIKLGNREAATRLRWVHAREFEYDGKMYDVVARETNADSTVYTVWCDHAETHLNRQLESLLIKAMGGHPQSRDRQQRLADFFKSLYNSTFQGKISEIQPRNSVVYPVFYQVVCTSIDLPPPSPPPKIG